MHFPRPFRHLFRLFFFVRLQLVFALGFAVHVYSVIASMARRAVNRAVLISKSIINFYSVTLASEIEFRMFALLGQKCSCERASSVALSDLPLSVDGKSTKSSATAATAAATAAADQ